MRHLKSAGLLVLHLCACAGCLSFAYDLLHPPLPRVSTYLLVAMMSACAIAVACEAALVSLNWVKESA